LVRAIGRWGLAALVVNQVIGSGIFGLPSVLARLVGSASTLGYLVTAAGTGVIMACFAEVASQFREAGGPYLYAQAAFGRFAGLQIGWLAWLVRLTSAAANANLFVIYLAEFWPQSKNPLPRMAILLLLVGILTAVNYRGVKGGAQLSSAFAVAKLTPLFLFICAGMLFLLRRHPPQMFPSLAGSGGWGEALLLLMFAYGGFEGGLIPLSEAKNPRRDVPFALFATLAAVATIYTLTQVVVLGVLPDPMATDRPLAAAARVFLGGAGAGVMAATALVSVYGYVAAAMLLAPRLTYAFAERGDFPAFFAAVHPKYRTPHLSILAFAVLFSLSRYWSAHLLCTGASSGMPCFPPWRVCSPMRRPALRCRCCGASRPTCRRIACPLERRLLFWVRHSRWPC